MRKLIKNMNRKIFFHHIAINSNSIRKTENFYKKYFGFKRAKKLKMENGNLLIHLKQKEFKFILELIEIENSDINGNKPFHLGFLVKDFYYFLSKIKNNKIKIIKGPYKIGEENIFLISDPSGNIIEVNDNL